MNCGAGAGRRRWLIHPALARRTGVKPVRGPRIFNMRQTLLWGLRSGAIVERIEGWAAGGARHGIEYRYPLLDRRLLQFALGLPPEQFLRVKWSRWLMRHALRGVLPASILWNRSKRDPARYDPMFDAFAASLPLVRELIEEREAPPSRACHLDMPRLLDHPEPPDPSEPLLTLPNVLVFPHMATATHETRKAMRGLAVENVLAVLAGRRPPAIVNPEALP